MDWLLKVSLVCALVGLAGLWMVVQWWPGELSAIASIGPEQVGSTVRVCGNITYRFVSKAGHIFMKIADGSGELDMVIFNTTADSFDVPAQGQTVCATGRIELYEGRIELLPVKIQTATDRG